MNKYLYYAAYGSNLFRERFLVYINGGEFRGRRYKGATDKTPPLDAGWMMIPYRLYFAKSSKTWDNKAVAFISCDKESDPYYHTLVRLWKITEDQFKDVHEQEGKGWYNVILDLGKKDGLEIRTITGCWEKEKNKPSGSYLEIIKKGLKETTSWSDDEIERYLEKFLI
ncbi:MAG: hypothetical protein N2202_07980 [Proteobacteria bacterium]|nr:hypothetical protein [Pseudomonadota bacterium]